MFDPIYLPATWHLNLKNNFNIAKNKFFCLLIGLIWTGILLFFWITGYGYTNSFNDMISQIPTRDYGIVLDCGSSGTRVFVYTWNRPPPDSDELLDISPLNDDFNQPVQLKVEPGLSSFANRPEAVIDYITPLLRVAEKHIPSDRHSETVLYMLATAGMRMIPEADQNIILSELRANVPKVTNFIFSDNHVDIISGKEEGVYAWISANYVLNRLKINPNGERAPSVGIIDMGGGSVQIAFEVPSQDQIPPDDFSQFNLGAKDTSHLEYKLFVTTHLGFGANVAMDNYRNMLVDQFQDQAISDPCLPSGATHSQDGVEFIGTGNYTACFSSLKPLLHKGTCSALDQTCSLNGHFQPSFDSVSEFFGFSEFFYTSEDCLHLAGRWNYDLFRKEAASYCATKWSKLQENWKADKYKADANRLKHQCFKSAWVPMVLHNGFNFPTHHKKLTTLQTIGGTEVQWALGALIFKSRFLPLREERISAAGVTHSHRISNFDSSLVLLIICMSFVIGFLLLNLKRIISQNRSTVYVRLPTRRRLEEDIV